MREAFIAMPLRTPIGKYRGALKDIRADDLAGLVIQAVVARAKLDPAAIDDVILGCANQAGEDNRNVARMALLLAGLPQSVPGATVNRLCGSGLDAVVRAAHAIRAGEGEIFIAGGVESMTRAPWSMPKPAEGFPNGKLEAYDTSLGWRYPNPKLAAMFPLEQMGETAENVAAQYRIGREVQDAFALESHRRAVEAAKSGVLEEEIIPIELPQKKGAPAVMIADEGPRADTTLEKLAALKAAFRENGTVTAGNSSSLNDGAAALIVASEAAVKRFKLTPLARFVSSGSAGVDPRYMGMGPVPATQIALQRAVIAADQLDAIELNEAFAAQALAVIATLQLDPAKVNPNGGAIAIGHPLGCSGARLAGTLARQLARTKGRYGLATMCIGVGQGIAAVFQRV